MFLYTQHRCNLPILSHSHVITLTYGHTFFGTYSHSHSPFHWGIIVLFTKLNKYNHKHTHFLKLSHFHWHLSPYYHTHTQSLSHTRTHRCSYLHMLKHTYIPSHSVLTNIHTATLYTQTYIRTFSHFHICSHSQPHTQNHTHPHIPMDT